MTSQIDISKPVSGPTATTESIRNNMSIIKTEIEDLQDNKQDKSIILDNTTASFTTDQQTKLSNLPDNFNNSVDGRINNQKGSANGICPLGSDSKIASTYLPSYVDDVIEVANFAALPATGETGKIYVLQTPTTVNNITTSQFRWTGSAYVGIVSSPGTTDAVTEGTNNKYFTATRAVESFLPVAVNFSRNLAQSDNGQILDCTATGIDLTLPPGLINFGCGINRNGTTRIIPGSGVTINGSTATLTVNSDVAAIIPTSKANAYKSVGT